MPQLREISFEEATAGLPTVQSLRADDISAESRDTLFLCALGFEDRCLSVPEFLADSGYRTARAIVFEYPINEQDNERNRSGLVRSLERISSEQIPLQVAPVDFPQILDRALHSALGQHGCGQKLFVTFDISACSSRLILEVLGALLVRDIGLRIAYSEAAVYHPTRQEWDTQPNDWLEDAGFGMARGVVSIWESSVYPGCNPDHLPNLLVAFPTFKRERTQKLISSSEAQVQKTVWIVGVPHLPENRWRVEAMRDINALTPKEECYEVSTFGYTDCLTTLEDIYRKYQDTRHVLVSPLGSKLQDVAIAVFLQLRPDVSVWFSTPKEYNPNQYTEGTLDLWRIDFPDLPAVTRGLRSYGKLQIVR